MTTDQSNLEAFKVTMKMSEETYEDLKEIVQLTGNTNKTDIIGTALRLYRELLEFKGEKDGKLSIETKSDQRHIRADLSI